MRQHDWSSELSRYNVVPGVLMQSRSNSGQGREAVGEILDPAAQVASAFAPERAPEAPLSGPGTFDAFLSYRRLRAAPLALWLRGKVKRYKPSRSLLDRLPDEVRSRLQGPRELFLDTAFSRANEDFWGRQIVPGLKGIHPARAAVAFA